MIIVTAGGLYINSAGQLVEGSPGQIGLFDGPHSDMSIALGLTDTSESRVYHGWYPKYWSAINPYNETEYQKWTRILWERLGAGDNVYDALTYTINQQTEFGDDAPVNNYRLKGQGFLTDIRLRSN